MSNNLFIIIFLTFSFAINLELSKQNQPIEDSRIAWGSIVESINEYPFNINLFTYFGSNGLPFCSASLIDEEWLVTAAHCAEAAQENIDWGASIYAFMGTNSIYVYEETFEANEVLEIFIHPEYNVQTIQNDIAVFKIAPVQFNEGIQPILLSNIRPEHGSFAKITGYGSTENYSGEGFLREARMIINDEDIIGAITVDDAGLKGSANTVSVSISDPKIRYDTRSVTFFKSEYLNEDRNIPKKKDVKTPLVTNFFNARINAEQYLDQSRFNRKINFVIGPKGLLLLSGTIIKINYARFGWVEKEYRISNLSYRADCSVQITAYEHNDASYIVTPKQKPVGTRPAAAGPGDELVSPFPPNGLTATGSANSVTLNWTNTVGFGGGVDTGWATQIWVNNNISFNNQTADTEFADGAVLLHTTKHEESYVHKLPNITSDTVRYYWVRHTKEMQKVKNSKVKAAQVISIFNPTSDSNGVAATATAAAASSGIVYLYKSSVNEPTDDPTSDSLFPTLLVSLTGANAGKITGVKSGQGSAALTNNQVIDTNGDATGWFINPVNPTDNTHVVYI